MSAKFEIHLGSGKKCGPSYLRAAEREEAVTKIRNCGSVQQFRANEPKE